MVPACFPLKLTIFPQSLQVFGELQFILVKRLLDALEPVVELIEEKLELVDVDFSCVEGCVLWLRVLIVNYSKSEKRSPRKASYRLSILIIIITVRLEMKIRVQLIENSPLHRVPSIFLNTHRMQFVFNVIPSLLRHKKLHKLNLHNSSHIFFTKNSVEAVGGLPNYMLFRSGTEDNDEVVANKIYLFGNTQMVNYLEKLRFKLGYKALRFSFTNWKKSKFRFGIGSIPLYHRLKADPRLPNLFVRIEDHLRQKWDKKDYFDSRAYISTRNNQYLSTDRTYFHSNELDIYPLAIRVEGTTYTNYLCIVPQLIKGKDVNVEKFIEETKVTLQQDLKHLLSKGFVDKDSKRYLKEDFVFEQNFKPSNILIFHYSSTESVQKIIENNLFKNYFDKRNKTGLVIHIVEEASTLSSDVFKQFIGKFEETTKHLWFGTDFHKMGEEEGHLFQENIQELKAWSQAFPSIVSNIFAARMKHYHSISANRVESLFPNLNNFIYKRVFSFMKNDFSGDKYEERKQIQPKSASRISLLKSLIENNAEKISQLQQLIPARKKDEDFSPKVVFLGTNSSMPIILRNTAGILVSLNPEGNILLDCGQETFEQMANHFDPETFEQELLKLRVIFITHIHSDHNLGILNLISQRQHLMRRKGSSSKLFLIIPFNVYNWYAQFNSSIEDLSESCDVVFTQLLQPSYSGQQIEKEFSNPEKSQNINSCNLNRPEDQFFSEIQSSARTKQLVELQMPYQKRKVQDLKEFLRINGYSHFQPVRVLHCPQSFGIVIKNGSLKVSYSGDTRPSEDFRKAALESDLMIHEATFNDEQAELASNFLHSTVKEAVSIGKRSQSKKIVLTHFSSSIRVPQKLQSLSDCQQYFRKDTILAFDHLEIPLEDNDHLPQITKFISGLNEEASDEFNSS